MSVTKITIYTRPSINVAFPLSPSAEAQAQINTVLAPAKLLAKSRTISDDLLTLTITQEFVSEEAYNEFEAHPPCVAYRAERDAYAAQHGITIQSTVA